MVIRAGSNEILPLPPARVGGRTSSAVVRLAELVQRFVAARPRAGRLPIGCVLAATGLVAGAGLVLVGQAVLGGWVAAGSAGVAVGS
jgi:hypothetical protein